MLFGEGVRLRAIEREDLPMFVRWFNDPEVRRYTSQFAPISLAEEELWFEALLKDENSFIYVIEATTADEATSVGTIILRKIDWRNRSGEYGIAIGEKAYQERGLGTEATRVILRFAFEEVNLHRVYLTVLDFNERAIHVYEKLGFTHEGARRQAQFREGKYHDILVMSMLRHEFDDKPG